MKKERLFYFDDEASWQSEAIYIKQLIRLGM
jgi:hypothetical protein